MATIASLAIGLSANSAQLKRDLNAAKKSTKKFTNDTKAQFKTMAKGIGAALTIGGFQTLQDDMDTIAKNARSIGFDTTSLQAFNRTMELAGVESGTFKKSIISMQKAIGGAGEGLKTNVDVIESIGLSYGQLAALSPEEQFLTITEALSNVQDESKRAYAGSLLLGRGYQEMGTAIEGGRDEIERMNQEQIDQGDLFDADAIASAEAYNDAITEVKDNFKAFAANNLDGIADLITKISGAFMEFSQEHPTLTKLGIALVAVAGAVALFGGPMTAIAAAITLAVIAWDDWDIIVDKVKDQWDKFGEKFPVVSAIIETAFSGISTAITTAKDLFDAFWDLFAGEGTFGERLKTFFGDVGDIILGIFKAPLNGVMQLMEDAVNGLVDKIPDAFLPKSIEDGISLPRFATGGAVFGAGNGTSDSIPALLSNGEYVINAKQTAKHRGLLEQINNGTLPGFKNGGMVGSPHASPVVIASVVDAQKYADKINKINRDHIAFADEIRSEYASAVSGGIISGFKDDGIKGAIRNIANVIAQKFEQRATDALTDALFGVQGTKSTGLVGGFFSSILGFADGGMVPKYYSKGGFVAKGTDTVPAMLTPGEVILNAAQQKNVAKQMGGSSVNNYSINISGNVDQRSIDQIREVIQSSPTQINSAANTGKRSASGIRRKR